MGRAAIEARTAQETSFEWLPLQCIGNDAGIAERHPSNADNVHHTPADCGLRNIGQPLLQVRISGAYINKVRALLLQLVCIAGGAGVSIGRTFSVTFALALQ